MMGMISVDWEVFIYRREAVNCRYSNAMSNSTCLASPFSFASIQRHHAFQKRSTLHVCQLYAPCFMAEVIQSRRKNCLGIAIYGGNR